MRTPSAGSAQRLGELALLTTAFVLPLAFSLHSYDPASLKFAVLQWSALAMLFGWLWQGISRGRFQVSVGSWSVLLPALLYGAWLVASFAAGERRLAALPDFTTRLTMLAAFLAALLGFSGARFASRFAALTVGAALLAAAAAALSRDFAAVAGPSLASLFAVAVPLALTLELDPETPRPARVAALALLPAAGACLILSSAPLAPFCASLFVFAALIAVALRSKAGLRAAGLALLTVAAVAAFGRVAFTFPPPAFGAAETALLVWLFAAALWTGARAASALRRAGALSESRYAAGFAAAAAGALAAAYLGAEPLSPAAGWYAWPLAGLAAGLAPLAARRAAVSVYPLPVSESVRRALYAPAVLGFAGLALLPGLWLRSDVALNSAVYAARGGEPERALELYAKILPGSRHYLASLYFTGDALNELGRHEEALAAFDLLQEQSPDFPLVHGARGEAYAKLDDWTSAARARARQAELAPRSLKNLIAWAEAARASGDLVQAGAAAGKAAALDANDAGVKLQLAANDLMERRQLAKQGRGKTNGRGVVKKPKRP
ncbi:MAG: hypothetical protein Q8T11_01835 [Elusimicrobiota bacterium]|nr:hypothetical protein [Elusimicrobiota bacterium]